MGSMRSRSKLPTSRASLMGAAKASHPAAAGDAVRDGRSRPHLGEEEVLLEDISTTLPAQGGLEKNGRTDHSAL